MLQVRRGRPEILKGELLGIVEALGFTIRMPSCRLTNQHGVNLILTEIQIPIRDYYRLTMMEYVCWTGEFQPEI